MRLAPALCALVACALLATGRPAAATGSRCFGTVSRGRIEGSVPLPERSANFTPYSRLAVAAGRTHVHSTVAAVVADAYAALAASAPERVFVYGETGWPSGGRLRPHRTHQNGLSVDFFVPVRDAQGRAVPLPSGWMNRFGYDIEFDSQGRFDGLAIDFEAMAEHLYQLDLAARRHGIGLALFIFDPPLLPRLFATRRGAWLRERLPVMKGRAWVRHDEHYHVDFRLPCGPLHD